MKKIAIFVEGLTEQIFIIKFILFLCKKNGVEIKIESLTGGANSSQRTIEDVTVLQSVNKEDVIDFYFLIRNSNTDSKVKSDMIDGLNTLHEAGFSKVIGLRDTYPTPKNDISNLIKFQGYGFPNSPKIPYSLLFAVSEIEAWFIADTKHFKKIDNKLAPDFIKDNSGVDINNIDIESIEHPAEVLHNIYKLVGLAYRKKERHFHRTIDAMDFDYFVKNGPQRSNYLASFITEFNDILV
ncbi:MAG: hypothetical protein ACJAR4_002279 [Psychroserpens sp.]|jgi:hypothetical protein